MNLLPLGDVTPKQKLDLFRNSVCQLENHFLNLNNQKNGCRQVYQTHEN